LSDRDLLCEDLPASGVVPMSGVVDRLIDEKNGDQDAVLADMDKHLDGLTVRGMDGSIRGWWPVCTVNWYTMVRDHGFTDHRQFFALQAAGKIPLYATCWYQLADGSWILIAWPVFAISRL
jgi:hypothetical protein